jgi:ankyrin repeat protein
MNADNILLIAAQAGILYDMRNSLALGADPDAQEADGYYALHGAAASGNIEAVVLLLDHHADMEVTNPEFETPVQFAFRLGRNSTAYALLSAGADGGRVWPNGNTIMHYAAMRGDSHLIQKIIESGASPDQRNKEGISPIRYAVLGNHVMTVKRLIEECAEINADDFIDASQEIAKLLGAWRAIEWIK